MCAYNQSFKTIIQSHCSKLTPIASLHDEKMDDTVLLFAFNLELPETERNIQNNITTLRKILKHRNTGYPALDPTANKYLSGSGWEIYVFFLFVCLFFFEFYVFFLFSPSLFKLLHLQSKNHIYKQTNKHKNSKKNNKQRKNRNLPAGT